MHKVTENEWYTTEPVSVEIAGHVYTIEPQLITLGVGGYPSWKVQATNQQGDMIWATGREYREAMGDIIHDLMHATWCEMELEANRKKAAK